MKPGEIYKIETKRDEFKDLMYIKFSNAIRENGDFIFDFKAIDKKGEEVKNNMNGVILYDLIRSGEIKTADDSDKAKLLLSQKGF